MTKASVRARSLTAVPWPVYALLLGSFLAQLEWSAQRNGASATIRELPAPPATAMLRVAAFGQPELLARLTMLWLQAFDYQPGVSVAFRDLDYRQVEAWLERMLELDPGFQYPLLAAARLYGEVPERDKQLRMMRFIARQFPIDPVARWQWMAHAVYLAKHRLHDLELALELARELAAAEPADGIPHWALQMHIFVLEDMGEIESAKVLLGGLLDSGKIGDAHERWFLSQRLHELQQRGRQP
jgi:hypothetical protein